MSDFNFFEPYLDPPIKPNYNRLLWLLLFVAVIGIISYLQFSYMGKKMVMESETSLNRDYIESSDVKAKVANIAQKQIAFEALESISNDLSLYEDILKIKGKLEARVFDLINRQVPQYVFVSSMDLNSAQVSITGYSDSYQSIALFQHQLRKIDLFSDVFVPSIVENQGNYEFSITAFFMVEVANENK